ncbi:MAG: hypothetical protein JWO31_144, partial [Phycisphaerales bacterium]|nr:hypothetical protein [Phycisphaerales bacterium]
TALLVEYEQVIRTMSSQLETRVAKLDLLIREADDKLAALRTATAEAGRAADRRPPVLDLLAASGRVAALPGSTGSSGLPSGDEAGIGFQGSSELEVVARVEPRPPHADVYGLADEGLGYRQIAQRLDRPYGEIELILALRPKRAARAKGEEESATAAEPAPRGFRPDDQPELVGVLVPGESHGSSSSSERRRPRRSSSEHSPSERA